ncbi:DMT family transporter [Intestinibacter bartlettii]|uniref:DMT family transporter n=1 Tax=Intestinibacter bartlettii TaxID=261299 RepID=A0ABS6DZE3_9FIRM|nr:DMT family transporter [Intestinibacter bartlettii]MBU5337209.1 DMT family transporter [Intestinibacter bartlettii]
MKNNNKEIFYKLCLVLCSVIWGSTFVVIKDATNTMSSGFINAGRFTIATAILLIVYFKKIKNINKSELKHGIMMGISLFGGYYLQVLGMEYGSTAGKCAFLAATFCVMVPFLSWVVFKRTPDKYSVIAAILCIIGVALVSVEKNATITLGDAIILISAFFYAVNIMLTSEFSSNEQNDATVLAFLQIAVVAVLSWITVGIKGEMPQVYHTRAIMGVIYLGVFATALCLLIQVIGLKHINSTSASIILSLESVFGVMISVVFYNEVITSKLLAGFTIIFIGIIVCETKLSFIKDKIGIKKSIEGKDRIKEDYFDNKNTAI